MAAGRTRTASAAGRYASLTVVRDGDGYVLGSHASPDFVAVPEIGGQVVLWLQAGVSAQDCERRAGDVAGEPVDVPGFLDGLVQAGLLAADEQPEPGPGQAGPPQVSAWQRAAGRVLFGRAGLTAQGLLAVGAVVALVSFPRLRPSYGDAIATAVPLLNIMIIAVLGLVLGLAHELAHVLAAWAAGVPSRVSISRRMIAIVYQTDLTRLWSVPRRSRIVPLLAGTIFDAAVIGVLAGLELTMRGGPPGLATHLLRAVVFLKVSAVAFQFLIFMRTDMYALFVQVTGCKHLWVTKGAIARTAIRRSTSEDAALLASAGRREIFWAKVFLCLYVPGVLFTGWYFVVFALPAIAKNTAISIDALSSGGLLSVAGAAAALALALIVASTGYVCWGLIQTLARTSRQLITRRARPADPA